MKNIKRLIGLIVVMSTLISCLVGCGNSTNSGSEGGQNSNTKKEVELTAENIQQYFQFNLKYDNFETHNVIGVSFASSDVILEIYPTVSGKIANVKVKVEITCPSLWNVTSSDPAYNKADTSKMIIDIVLPADGKYTSTHNIGRSSYAAKPSNPCTIKILEASGTFTSD